MKFPYREYVGAMPGTSDFRLILRPVISVRIAGPQREARWDALVDTGADETLLPIALAGLLDIRLDEQWTSHAAGISGDKMTIYYGDVRFAIESADESISWQTTVGFVDFATPDDEVVILGHGGCLDYFTAVFHGDTAELELTANSTLPSL